MKITILGTAGMLPTDLRNPSSILISYKGHGILIDCGEGTQKQFRKAKIKLSKITKLLITHWHGDHVLGIPGLIQSLGAQGYDKVLEIYGPKGTKYHINNMLKGVIFTSNIKYIVKEIGKGVFHKNEDFYLEASPIKHNAPCLSYSFIEKDKRNINLSYTKKFGLTKHPIMKKLQQGKNINYDGKKILASKATKIKKGKKINIIVDTSYNKSLAKIAKNADLLICEATWLEKDKIKEYSHLTSTEAAKIAKAAKVKKLVLTHFSQRYKTLNGIKKEARKIFKATECAKDLMEIKV